MCPHCRIFVAQALMRAASPLVATPGQTALNQPATAGSDLN
jgi:hypothetical protein